MCDIKMLGLGMIWLIFPSMCADISRGEEMTMIFLLFAIFCFVVFCLISLLWEELQGRFALFAFKFVFSRGKRI